MGIGSVRNKPCYCGSGKKFKKCHLYIDMPKNMAEIQAKAMKMFLDKQTVKVSDSKAIPVEGDVVLPDSKPQTEIKISDEQIDKIIDVNPPDLSVKTVEAINTEDKFGRR